MMTENLKTVTLVGVAIVTVAATWYARGRTSPDWAHDDSGQPFYASFDPLQAKSLTIVKLDPQSGAPRSFQVTQRNDVWSLPSNENYPADAEKQLAAAAASLADIIKGPSVTDSPGDHELYGVLDPMGSTSLVSGAGTRIRLADASDRPLAEFIVGKPVKDNPGLRYVRVPDKDRVYECRMSIDKLSTKFEDWIEKDLLKMNVADIMQIMINPYSIDELNQRIIPGDLIRFTYESKDNKWGMDGLAEGEELVVDRIEQLRNALTDLKIVDVHRKPAGLSQELRAAEALRLDQPALDSLAAMGYYVVNNQLLSNEGEMIVSLKSGIQYMLRFGEVATTDRSISAIDEQQSMADQPPGGAGANRYVFLTVQFNESLIPQPQIDHLPEESNPPKSGDEEMDKQVEQLIEDARKRITEANSKKQDEYLKTLEDGRKKVQELNNRFADWYYVISDEVYRKIRLTRAEAVKTVAPPSAEPESPPQSAPEAAPEPAPSTSGADLELHEAPSS